MNVIKYRTVGGNQVVVMPDPDPALLSNGEYHVLARCDACFDSKAAVNDGGGFEEASDEPKRWAQNHARTCYAI